MLAFILSACCFAKEQVNEELGTEEQKTEITSSNGKVQIRWFVGLGTGTEPAQIEIQQACNR